MKAPYQVEPNFTNIQEGIHQLSVKYLNDCIEKNILFTILIAYKFPKFFTPNNDGVNDRWNVLDFSNSIKNITIFNRFGKHLKIISPNSDCWDGNSNGQALYADNYWYLISFQSGETVRGYFILKR
jgi:gliding motility-associated-like protein